MLDFPVGYIGRPNKRNLTGTICHLILLFVPLSVVRDLENNLLTVFAQKTQKNREIPINAKARRVLEYWALGRKNEFVFYNHETGDRFRDLDTGLRLACEKAGIEGITWHRLRHTFTTRLLEQGVDVVTAQQLLGHSTVVRIFISLEKCGLLAAQLLRFCCFARSNLIATCR